MHIKDPDSNLVIPVEHPEEFESESVHSTGSGNEKSVHSCLRSDLTWYDKWLFIPEVSDKEVKALVTLTLSDSENHTGGVEGYVSCKSESKSLTRMYSKE